MSTNYSRKLTPEIIEAILARKLTPTQLSRKYNISRTTIYKVLRSQV